MTRLASIAAPAAGPVAAPEPSRVVMINDHCRPNGGAAVLMLSALRMLRARGMAVTLITGDAGDNPELAELGVEVIAAGGLALWELVHQRPRDSSVQLSQTFYVFEIQS